MAGRLRTADGSEPPGQPRAWTGLLAEGIVRLVLPQALILRRPDVWYPVAGLGWDRSPNLDTTVNFGGAGPVRLITDNEGNRIGRNGRRMGTKPIPDAIASQAGSVAF